MPRANIQVGDKVFAASLIDWPPKVAPSAQGFSVWRHFWLISARLVDELSQVVVPSVEGVSGNPAVFDIYDRPGALAGMGMELISSEVREKGSIWLRYRFSWTA